MLSIPTHGTGFICGPAMIDPVSCDRFHVWDSLPDRAPFGVAYVISGGADRVIGAASDLSTALHSAAEYVTAFGPQSPTAHVVVGAFVGTRPAPDATAPYGWHVYGA